MLSDVDAPYRFGVISADVHRARLKPILEAAAASLLAAESRVTWHIEDIQAIHYALDLLLVFVDPSVPEQDLVVVAVSASNGPPPEWTIDALYRNDILIAEEPISLADAAEMSADANIAAGRLTRFLDDAHQRLSDAVSGRLGEIAPR